MATHATDDELAAEQTEGFKVGEKKTIDEYQKLGHLLYFPPIPAIAASMRPQQMYLDYADFRKNLKLRDRPDEEIPAHLGLPDYLHKSYCSFYIEEGNVTRGDKAWSTKWYRQSQNGNQYINTRQPWIRTLNMTRQQVADRIFEESLRQARCGSARRFLETRTSKFDPDKPHCDNPDTTPWVRALPSDFENSAVTTPNEEGPGPQQQASSDHIVKSQRPDLPATQGGDIHRDRFDEPFISPSSVPLRSKGLAQHPPPYRSSEYQDTAAPWSSPSVSPLTGPEILSNPAAPQFDSADSADLAGAIGGTDGHNSSETIPTPADGVPPCDGRLPHIASRRRSKWWKIRRTRGQAHPYRELETACTDPSVQVQERQTSSQPSTPIPSTSEDPRPLLPRFKAALKYVGAVLKEVDANDQNDESLRKWKESLGLGSGNTIGDASDPRKCIILSLGLEVEGRPDIIIDLTSQGALEQLKDKPFTIKEGATFRMKARFTVHHQILSGMKYIQVVKRMGISNKMQEMIGSYSPNTTDKPEYEKKFESETAPSGMMGRGSYTAVSRFVDDDQQEHLKFAWAFDIKKDW